MELLPHWLHLGSGGASAMVTVIGPAYTFCRSPFNHPPPGSPVPAYPLPQHLHVYLLFLQEQIKGIIIISCG